MRERLQIFEEPNSAAASTATMGAGRTVSTPIGELAYMVDSSWLRISVSFTPGTSSTTVLNAVKTRNA